MCYYNTSVVSLTCALTTYSTIKQTLQTIIMDIQIEWKEYPANKPDYHRVRFKTAEGKVKTGRYSKSEDKFYSNNSIGHIEGVTHFVTNKNKNKYAT